MLSYVAVVHMYKKKISVIFQSKDRIDAGKTPRSGSLRGVPLRPLLVTFGFLKI